MVLKSCEKCLVYGTDGQRWMKARVLLLKDRVELYFDNYKLKNARIRVPVDFYDASGCIRTFCEILIKRNPAFPEIFEPWMGCCEILKEFERIQRQKDVRANVDLAVEFRSEESGNFPGRIGNISAGGIYLQTAHPLKKNATFSFTYNFAGKARTVEAMALWAKRDEKNSGYGYGCQFIGLNETTEADIRNFVYKQLKESEKKK